MTQANKTGKTQTRNTVRQDKVVRVEDLHSPPVMEQVLPPVVVQLAGQLLEQHGISASPWPLNGRLLSLSHKAKNLTAQCVKVGFTRTINQIYTLQ